MMIIHLLETVMWSCRPGFESYGELASDGFNPKPEGYRKVRRRAAGEAYVMLAPNRRQGRLLILDQP
jgi:hypothetical protein